MKCYIVGNTLTELKIRSVTIEYVDTLPRMSGVIGLYKRILETEQLRLVWDNLTLDFNIVRLYQDGKNWYARIEDKTGFRFVNTLGRNWYFRSGYTFALMIQELINESVEYEGIAGSIKETIIFPRSMTRSEAVAGIIKDLCMDLEYREGFKLRDIPIYPSNDITAVYTSTLETDAKCNIVTVKGYVSGQELIYSAYNHEDVAEFGELPAEYYESNITVDQFSINRLAQFKLELANYKESYTFKTKVQDIRINDIIILRNYSNEVVRLRVRKIVMFGNFMTVWGYKL